MAAKKTAKAVRTFNDAGTGETFEGGKSHEFEAGALANYVAAGLVEDPDAPKAKDSKADA